MESLIFCKSAEMLELCDLQFLFSRQCISNSYIFLPVFKFHDRKQKYFLDIIGVFKNHGDLVDAQAPAICGGQPIFQGSAEVFIYKHVLQKAAAASWGSLLISFFVTKS